MSPLAACRRKQENGRPSPRRRLTFSHDARAARQPRRVTYKFVVANERQIRRGLPRASSTSSTPEESGCGPTTICRRRRPASGSRARRSNTRGRCSSPIYPYIGEANVRLGLYDPPSGKRLPLAGEDVGSAPYKVGEVPAAAPDREHLPMFKDGWHPAEAAANNAAVEWQWTKKKATLSFKNPKKDSTFYLGTYGFQNFGVGITLLEHCAFSVDQDIDDFPAISSGPQFPNPGLLVLAGSRDLVGGEEIAMIWSAHGDELYSRAVLHAAKNIRRRPDFRKL